MFDHSDTAQLIFRLSVGGTQQRIEPSYFNLNWTWINIPIPDVMKSRVALGKKFIHIKN